MSILVVGVAALPIWVRSAADRRYRLMQRDIASLRKGPELYDKREGKGGGTEPGNAWTDYRKAILAASDIWEPDRMNALISRAVNADTKFGEELVATRAVIFDHLRSGTRMIQCDRGVPRNDYADHQHVNSMVSYCVLKARSDVAAGDAQKAVDSLLLLCLFLRDFTHSGDWLYATIGLSHLDLALSELQAVLCSTPLPRSTLENVDRTLEEIDETLPDPKMVRLQKLLIVGEQLTSVAEGRTPGPGRPLRLWRYGFSRRGWAADVFYHWAGWLGRSAAAEDLPWSECLAEFQRLTREIDTGEPGGGCYRSGFLDHPVQFRSIRARLRMLRIATGSTSDFPDPFGRGALRVRRGPSTVIWSVGPDGVDDGGSPSKDTVLTLPGR